MITIKEFPNQTFANRKEVFEALRANKDALIAAKKMQTKQADAFSFSPKVIIKGETVKSINPDQVDAIKVSVVINTTNIFDSHNDVHISGIWNKSVKEKRNPYLLQEHQMSFSHIISDEVKAKVDKTTFKALGLDLDGSTEALVFDTNIQKNRNEYMFYQYTKGFVKNHSVGMMYVKIKLALDSDDELDETYKFTWDKYVDSIANKDEAIEAGFFWAVLEAKIIEGSAVPLGSNWATPTLSTEAVSDTSKSEPSKDTQKSKLVFINLKN